MRKSVRIKVGKWAVLTKKVRHKKVRNTNKKACHI